MHAFAWKLLMAAPIIALSRPSLNEQIDSKKLLLFILLICNYV